jgi:hypothetical protein
MNDTQSQVGGVSVCVLGMHRSGTSALMRMLGLLGVEIGTDFCPPGPDNPTGFWELLPIVRAHDELLDTLSSAFDDFWPLANGWESRADVAPFRTKLIEIARSQFAGKPLWGFKDPRTCRLMPMWRTIFSELGTSPRYVVLVRHPLEICASMAAQNGTSINHALLMTLEHKRCAELSTRGQRRVLVTYDQLLTDWRGTAGRIARELAVTWPVPIEQAGSAVDAFLDPSRRHQRADPRAHAPPCDAKLLALAQRQYDLLADAATGKALSPRGLDRVNAKVAKELTRHAGWRERRSARREVMQLRDWALDRTTAIEFLTKERDYFREKLAELPPQGPAAAEESPTRSTPTN